MATPIPADAPYENIPCNLCGADDTIERIPSTLSPDESDDWRMYACTSGGYGHHGPIVQCKQCGFVYASPRRQSGDVLEIYETVKDPLYLEERQGRILTFERHLKPMEAFTGPAQQRRLLDVGAYTGIFVNIAQRHGWDALGIEPSEWAVNEARMQGLTMQLGTLENAELPDAHFSVVTMWDVIEHVPDPRRTLEAAWRVLEPGGYLIIHTMDIDSLFSRLLGKHWPWYMEMHLFYFSRRTLSAMLNDVGFNIVWMGAQGRYLQAGYLASRVTALMPWLGKPVEWAIDKLNMRSRPVRVNLGDLFTTYAQKPASGSLPIP